MAGDAVAEIPSQYTTSLAGAVAVVLLIAFVGVLVGTFIYERRLGRRSTRR